MRLPLAVGLALAGLALAAKASAQSASTPALPTNREPRLVVIEAEVWELTTPIDQLTLEVALATSRAPGLARSWRWAPTWFRLGLRESAELSPILARDSGDQVPLFLHAIANLAAARLVVKPFAVAREGTETNLPLSRAGCFYGTVTQVPAVEPPATSSTLQITPRLEPSLDVTMDVSLRASDTDTSAHPVTITVPVGRYAVLRGPTQETERTVEEKVPVLGDLPLLGRLFRRWTRTREHSRVYIFIRPSVIGDRPAPGPPPPTEARRDAWLPLAAPERQLQDEAFERFGPGTCDPFVTRSLHADR